MFINLVEDEREHREFFSRLSEQICSFVDPDRYRQWNARREVLKAGIPRQKPPETSGQQREEIQGLILDHLKREPYEIPEEVHPTL